LTSFYFEDIFERYSAEIDDLRSDSEGKDVLKKRLRDKHKEFAFLLSMMDTAPRWSPRPSTAPSASAASPSSMAPPTASPARRLPRVERTRPHPRHRPVGRAAGRPMPRQGRRRQLPRHRRGARTHARQRPRGARRPASARDDEEQDEDLGEAGDEWMAEQGFDSVER
jgi:hypothetical protein